MYIYIYIYIYTFETLHISPMKHSFFSESSEPPTFWA